MKKGLFLSAAVFTTTAFFLFRLGRKKKRLTPIMTFNDLYEDNNLDHSASGTEVKIWN